jgi:hypothetical protein
MTTKIISARPRGNHAISWATLNRQPSPPKKRIGRYIALAVVLTYALVQQMDYRDNEASTPATAKQARR